MNSRFYATAAVALLLAAAYNGGAKRPAPAPASAAGQPLDIESAQTAGSQPPAPQAALPRS